MPSTIIVLLMKNWKRSKEIAAKVWDGVKAIWSVVAQWFTDNVADPINDAFNNEITSSTHGVKFGMELKAL